RRVRRGAVQHVLPHTRRLHRRGPGRDGALDHRRPSRAGRGGDPLHGPGHMGDPPPRGGDVMNARTLLAGAACVALAACSSGHDNFDKSTQYVPDPQLPEPSRALLPRMKVSKVVGWAQGETPTVPQGFKIEAIATGLSSPRNVHSLPNGDLLVVESRKDAKEPLERPKRKVMDWVEAKAHGGGGNGPSN